MQQLNLTDDEWINEYKKIDQMGYTLYWTKYFNPKYDPNNHLKTFSLGGMKSMFVLTPWDRILQSNEIKITDKHFIYFKTKSLENNMLISAEDMVPFYVSLYGDSSNMTFTSGDKTFTYDDIIASTDLNNKYNEIQNMFANIMKQHDTKK